jgi:DNA invertase Pin-like site-specific DNA recombinase
MQKFIALYVRTSGSNQVLGLAGQESALREYLNRLPASDQGPIKLFIDDNYSGRRKSRPALDAMLKDIELGEIQCVLTYSISRIARSIKNLIDLEEQFRKAGVKLVSITESIDTGNATGRLTFQLIGIIGEFQASISGENTKNSLREARAKGIRLGRPVKIVALDKLEIQKMYGNGESMREIARQLDISVTSVSNIINKKVRYA